MKNVFFLGLHLYLLKIKFTKVLMYARTQVFFKFVTFNISFNSFL